MKIIKQIQGAYVNQLCNEEAKYYASAIGIDEDGYEEDEGNHNNIEILLNQNNRSIKMNNTKMIINGYKDTEFCIEICHTPMAAAAYYQGQRLPNCKKAGGSGYDREGVVLAHALNCLTGQKLSNNAGEGIDAVVEDAIKAGIKIERITCTKSGKLYRFTNLNAKGI